MRSSLDDRAVSTTLGYSLALVITAILVSGLLVTGSGFVDTQTERVVRSELVVLGENVAGDVEAADRLSRTPGNEAVAVRTDLPPNVANRPYYVSVNATGSDELVLSTSNPDVSVSVPLETVRPLASTDVSGGPIRVVFDGSRLVVKNA